MRRLELQEIEARPFRILLITYSLLLALSGWQQWWFVMAALIGAVVILFWARVKTVNAQGRRQ